MIETKGNRIFCKILSGKDEKNASGSGLIAAKVLGVTSEKIKITIVRRIAPINTPTSPYNFINNIVVSAEARIFTKLLKPVFAYLRALGYTSVIYVDDSLLYGRTYKECLKNVMITLECLQELGFIIHPIKSILDPTQYITY